MNLESIKKSLQKAIIDSGIDNIDALKNDKTVTMMANKAYKFIPLIPFRIVVKFTLGKDGFRKLIFKIRDKMITTGSTDLSWLTLTEFKKLISASGDMA